MEPRKLTKIWLFPSTFGKEPTENYITLYKPTDKDAKIYVDDSSYQRLNKDIAFPLNRPYEQYTFEDIVNCPYLAFQNEGERKYYAFITDCSYINDGTVSISFKIDPFTTYLNDTIESKMLVERLTGSKSIPDPELNFNANQVLKKVDYDLYNGGSSYSYAQDVILLYVRNTSQPIGYKHGIDDVSDPDFWKPDLGLDHGFTNDLKFVKDERRTVTNDNAETMKEYTGPFVQKNDVISETDHIKHDFDELTSVDNLNFTLLGNHRGVSGPYTGYDIYAIPDMANIDGKLSGSYAEFFGANGCNIIGAEYRRILHPFPWEMYRKIYKLSMEDRQKMSEPFTIKLEDFNFPNNIPESLKQSPYYKRLFVSNDGSTVIDYNPSASPDDVNGNSSLLKEITITESPEMGSPIVYEFDSSDSNGGHQFWVDNTDRSIPFFADAALAEIAKNGVMFLAQSRKDFETLRLNVDKHLAHAKLNERYADSIFKKNNLPRLKHNQSVTRQNLDNTLDVSHNNLFDSQKTSRTNLENNYRNALATQKRNNNTSVTNLGNTQDTQKANLVKSQTAAMSNLTRSNSVKVSNLNRTLSASKTALDNNNKTSKDSLATSKNIAYHNNLNAYKQASDIRDINEKYSAYNVFRSASKIQKEFMLDQELSAKTLELNNKTAKKVLETSLGLGAAGASAGAIAKGFEQMVLSIVAGAVTATAALSSLEIKQKTSLDLWYKEWSEDVIPEDGGNPNIPWFSRGHFRNKGDWHSEGGIDSTLDQSPLFNGSYPDLPPIARPDYKPGIRQVKANLEKGMIAAAHYDKYGCIYDDMANKTYKGSEKEKINTEYNYGVSNIKYNNQKNVDLNNKKISRSVHNFNANRDASVNNLNSSNNNEKTNLNHSQGAETANLNKTIKTSMNNLKNSNDTSITNVNKSYNTSIDNNNNSLETAMNNLIRDINRQKDNLDRSLETEINSMVVDLAESIISIHESLASAIIDDMYEYYITAEIKYGKYSDFYNKIINAANNSSITVSSGTFWGKVAAGLNKFSIYDVGINARELNYCINHINRYGSYCGATKYSINLKPDMYVRTRDAHLDTHDMPLWATSEISDKLNNGIYVRDYPE